MCHCVFGIGHTSWTCKLLLRLRCNPTSFELLLKHPLMLLQSKGSSCAGTPQGRLPFLADSCPDWLLVGLSAHLRRATWVKAACLERHAWRGAVCEGAGATCGAVRGLHEMLAPSDRCLDTNRCAAVHQQGGGVLRDAPGSSL